MLHKNLIKYRKANKLTQKQVADKLHITPQAYSRYERDDARSAEPSAENLKILAKLYNVSVDELIGNKTNLKDSPEIDTLLLNHLDGLTDLPKEEQERIIENLREQALFMINRAKNK